MCVVWDVREYLEALDCADRTLGNGDAMRCGGNGGVLDSLRDDHKEESVDRVRCTRSSMASRVCCEMAEMPSSKVAVNGM